MGGEETAPRETSRDINTFARHPRWIGCSPSWVLVTHLSALFPGYLCVCSKVFMWEYTVCWVLVSGSLKLVCAWGARRGCCDETLFLTQCCSVKVKPYRMSEMMTCTERFHLIPPFPLFPSVPPICLPYLHLWPARSRDKTDIYRPSPTVCVKTFRGCVCLLCVWVYLNNVKACHPASKAK